MGSRRAWRRLCRQLKQGFMKEISAALKGISAIPVTPFKADGSIDWALLEANLDFLLRRNVRVVVTCGNTGEAASLTLEERKKIVSFASGRLKAARAISVVGVG